MKKLKNFLSLTLLAVTCCAPAYAKIDGTPANEEETRAVITALDNKIREHAQLAAMNCNFPERIRPNFTNNRRLTQEIGTWDFNTDGFDQLNNTSQKSFSTVITDYAQAIDAAQQGLNCRAWTAYALHEFESREIQCGYLKVNFQVNRSTCDATEYHDVIVFSKNVDGARKWYVCDPGNAAVVGVRKNLGLLDEAQKVVDSYDKFLCMPLNEYLRKYQSRNCTRGLPPIPDDLCGIVPCAPPTAKYLYRDDYREHTYLGAKYHGRYFNGTLSPGCIELDDWLAQANAMPM